MPSSRLSSYSIPFRKFLVADTLVLVAMIISQIVLSWLIANHGGAKDLALYFGSTAIITLLAMPLLSPIGDRYSSGRLIIGGLFLYAVQAAALAILATVDYYNIALLIALGAASAICYALLVPIMANIPVQVVSPDRLTAALGVQKGVQSVGRFTGPLVAGAILGAYGTAAALWFLSALLAGSAILSLNLGLPRRVRGGASGAGVARWWADLRSGMRASWLVPIDRSWSIVNFLATIFSGPAVGMLVPLKVTSLQLSGIWFGCTQAGFAIGVFVGSFYVSNKVIAKFGRYRVRVLSGVALGASLALAGAATSGPLLVVAFVLCGLLSSTLMLVGMTHRTLARPPDFRARMTAATMTLNQVASSIGPAIAGFALTIWPLERVFVAFGIFAAIAASAIVLVAGFRKFIELDHEEVVNWYGRHFPHAFRDASCKGPPDRA